MYNSQTLIIFCMFVEYTKKEVNMAQKKYTSDSTLSALVAKIKELFATKSEVDTALKDKADSIHTHTIAQISDLTVTSEDEGKILQVVNGAWVAATLPRYNGEVEDV